MNVKIITILIVGVVFTAGLVVSFGSPALAGDPAPGLDITIEQIPGGEVSAKIYDSSLSTKSVELVRMKIGDALLRYGIGGEDINKVTDVLEGSGVYEAELKSFLINIGIDKNGVNEIFVTLDELGTGFIKLDDEEKAISTSDAGVTTQAVEKIEIAVEQVKRGEVSTSGTGDATQGIEELEIAAEQIKIGEVFIPGAEDTPQPEVKAKAILLIKMEDKAISTPDDSFFDVFTELEIFIEVIAKDVNITKAEARKVVDALMKVSPTFTIDENGLQDDEEARLIAVVIISALKSELTAKKALDAFVDVTAKSLRGSDRVALVGFGSFSISKHKAQTRKAKYSNTTLERGYSAFNDASEYIIQNIKLATPEERKSLINELQTNRGLWDTEIVSMDLKIRENAKELRNNFRKRVETVIGHVDHGKTARIANAHRQGLLMTYRFSSAMARIDHILRRLESRVLKLETQGYEIDSFFDIYTSIEKAKNIIIENKAKLTELKATYEELLRGKNLQRIGEEAREIAKKLKTEIQTLHAKLGDIVDEIKQAAENHNSSRSNTQT